MALELRYYGDTVLREKAQPVAQVDDDLRAFAEQMGEKMYEWNGIGLAANQVGDLRRILVIDVTDTDERKAGEKRLPRGEKNPEVYINPEIVSSSAEDEPYNEGCLSIPGIEAEVYRPIEIRLRWMDLDGQAHEETFDGLRARVLQHEIDHLDGVMFVDHLGLVKRQMLAGRLNRLKQETHDRTKEQGNA